MKRIFLTTVAFVLFGVFTSFAQSQQVNVRVDGLSCPFCAYGLEKKFKKIEGAKDIKIDVDKGLLTFTMEKDKTVTEEEIKKKVKQAGFTPREITYSEATAKEEEKNKK